jgi:hypothetical protein
MVCSRWYNPHEMAQSAGTPATIRQLMTDFRSGSPEAAGSLMELFYPELRRMAAASMQRDQPGHTWKPTVLVNELYLELARVNALPPAVRMRKPRRPCFLAWPAS